MADWYQQLTSSPIGKQVASTLGLPAPAILRRHRPGEPILPGPALLHAPPGGRLGAALAQTLATAGVDVRHDLAHRGPDERFAAVLLDATGITEPAGLRVLQEVLTPAVRLVGPSGRVVLYGTPADEVAAPATAAAQHALTGFVRSLGKELRGGATANLVQVGPGAEDATAATTRFLLSGRSAFVAGQVIRIDPAAVEDAADPDRPHAGRVAVVTGAAQGIGAAIAEVLTRAGAHVVVLDVPAKGEQLAAVANRLGGASLQLDITADTAPEQLTSYALERHGGIDLVVHNAGITRDKTIAGMDADRWDAVIAVNLTSQVAITEELLARKALRGGGSVVCVSSLSGIAGNRGQTNYAASKAGVIGLVHALAPTCAEQRLTINAVAPGFIETEMTSRMPLAIREAGRRMNSLNQGGQPVDVAEAVSWLAEPGSAGINGQVVRVCGQSLLGA